jgi:hypothetical protein
VLARVPEAAVRHVRNDPLESIARFVRPSTAIIDPNFPVQLRNISLNRLSPSSRLQAWDRHP